MIGKVLNLPFKVLGGVARAVQAQDAKKRTQQNEGSAPDKQPRGIDIQVPDDFDAGPLGMAAETALPLMDSGCIVDATTQGAGIPNALRIPAADIGIRIAELPPETTIVVITDDSKNSDQIVRFLRHRGLDETWSLDGGLNAWKTVGGTAGETPK